MLGLIDNLTMNYNGNQLIKVQGTVSTSNISDQGDFRNEGSKTVEYEYDKNGNLTKYLNKRSDNITYNSLNLPISNNFNFNQKHNIYEKILFLSDDFGCIHNFLQKL